jgi:hypothetical protein
MNKNEPTREKGKSFQSSKHIHMASKHKIPAMIYIQHRAIFEALGLSVFYMKLFDFD